jgi:aldehyde dehydrogenase (NAD+)
LELGGKCPIIVDSTADVDFAAGRCVQGRFGNSGQTCVAPDYALVHEKHLKAFLESL